MPRSKYQSANPRRLSHAETRSSIGRKWHDDFRPDLVIQKTGEVNLPDALRSAGVGIEAWALFQFTTIEPRALLGIRSKVETG